jgi:hypothetical protein
VNDQRYVSIKEIAQALGMDRSHARKFAIKCGFEFAKQRTADSGNQLTLVLPEEKALLLYQRRKDLGFTEDNILVSSDIGFFYIIQLIPEYDKNRIKLGYANDVRDRLAQHRTSAPTAVLLKSYPCKREWEKSIIDFLALKHCRLINSEVYEAIDLEKMVDYADQLFSLIPSPEIEIEISEHSPLNREE